MAKIEIKKVVQDLDLDEYYQSGESQIIKVWVNPPMRLRSQHNDDLASMLDITKILAALGPETDEDEKGKIYNKMIEIGRRSAEFWSEIWSQGPDPESHFTLDEVVAFERLCNDQDPGLWQFVCTMSVGMMNNYLNINRKKEPRRLSTPLLPGKSETRKSSRSRSRGRSTKKAAES